MSGSPFLAPQDLLRQRRLDRGLPAQPPPLAEARPLLLLGGSIGTAALALVLATTGLLAIRQAQVAAELGSMQGVPLQVQTLETQVRAEQAKLNKLSQGNEALARGLVALSSGSALVTQLALLTPQGVQLTEVSVQGQTLSLKGLADDPGAFARVNAFSLLLAGSPLVRAGEVRVVKLSREGSAPNVSWELSAALASPPPAEQLPLLQRLGADGMAARLRDLLSLGVLR